MPASAPFKPTGFVLYLKQAGYASGTTALANWVERDAIPNFAQLVQQAASNVSATSTDVAMMAT